MNLQRSIAGALALLAGATTFAQPPGTEGEWRAKYIFRELHRQAEVVFKGDTGTWYVYNQAARDRNDPCVGRRFPMVVESREGGLVKVLVQRSAEAQGCPDLQMELRAVDNRLDGVLRSPLGDITLSLTRP